MPSSSLINSLVDSSYLSGFLDKGHTRVPRRPRWKGGCPWGAAAAAAAGAPSFSSDAQSARLVVAVCAFPQRATRVRSRNLGRACMIRTRASVCLFATITERNKVHFEGEIGVDDGGLSQEFFEILRRELCAPKTGIFRHFEDSQLIWFSRQVPAEEDIYFLIGNLYGMALYNMKIAAFPFPLALFKKMAKIQPTLEDLKELSPGEGSNLQELLDEQSDDIIENVMLNFTVIEGHEGSIVEIELKENGANIPVTKCNRQEYIDAYVNYLFNDSVKKQFGDFMRGFERGCPTKNWKFFLPTELRVVLFGHAKYDWKQLEKNAKYVHYEKSDETIEHFWAVFHHLPEENKKDFLAFLTGTEHIPAQGMEKFTFTIEDSRKEDPDRWRPYASTCVRKLHLPRYTDRDILEKMLLDALENRERFYLS